MTLQIEPLHVGAASDEVFVTALTDLINEVYEVAEKGLWTEGTTRTTREEVAALVRAEQIVVARLERRLVGCIRVQRLDLVRTGTIEETYPGLAPLLATPCDFVIYQRTLPTPS